MRGGVDITVLVCTYNRCKDLCEMIDSALAQQTGGEFTFEVLIVDNNSTDGTREAVAAYSESHPQILRYLFEPHQGKSNALITGARSARGTVLSIIDSDLVLLDPDYLQRVYRIFRDRPEVAVVGGKVLPIWMARVPLWLTERHWPAIAMCSYGEEPFSIDKSRPLCLLTASYRTSALGAAGGYRTNLAVSKGQIGGVEDADLLTRMYDTGLKGYYDPLLRIGHKVEPARLKPRYHRQWHLGHGRFCALWRNPEFEASRLTLLGVPVHLFRTALKNAVAMISRLPFSHSETFYYETQLWFFAGFFRQRAADYFRAKRGVAS